MATGDDNASHCVRVKRLITAAEAGGREVRRFWNRSDGPSWIWSIDAPSGDRRSPVAWRGNPQPMSAMADHAVSHYRELPPPRSLSDHLVCVWTQRIEGAGEYRHPVLPDGCVDIVWIGESPPVVAGPATRRVDVEVPTGTTIIGARLRPGWAATSLALPLDELLDQHVPLTDVLGRRAPSWADRALRRRPIPGRLREAIRALTKPLLAAAEADPGIRRSVTWLARHPKGRISRLADHLPVSERHLRRRFRAAVGYGPKTFQRIMRFQRLLTMARDGKRRMSLAALAHRVGYADQAHMCREVRRLADETPGSLLGRRKGTLSMSDLFKTEGPGSP